jgi:3-hydroxyacyl-[acyl-carrier-protein] dehydratase
LFTIELNPTHPIYAGHFPGNPVVPGVCQVQIIKELVASIIEKEASLLKSDNIKFLSIIDPVKTPVLKVRLDIKTREHNQWDINAVMFHDQLVFIKFKGVFTAV